MKIIVVFLVFIAFLGCKRNVRVIDENAEVNYVPLKECSFIDDLIPYIDTMICIVPANLLPSPLCKMLTDENGIMYMLGFRGALITLTQEV